MNLYPNVHPAELELTRLLAQHPDTLTVFENASVEPQIKILACSSDLDDSGSALFDLKQDRVIFAIQRFTRYLQHAAVCLDVQGNRTQIDRLTHPDEVGFWAEFFLHVYRAMMDLPSGERPAFFAAGTRRLLEKVGTYQSYMISLKPCIFTADGCPMMVMVKLRRLPYDDVPLFRFMSHYPAGYTETHAYSVRLRNLHMTPRTMEALALYSGLHSEKRVAQEMKLQLGSVQGYTKMAIEAMGVTSIRVASEIWRVISGAYM